MRVAWAITGSILVGGVLSAEPIPNPEELPRIPPKSLEEAQKSFQVREGFRVELAAGEPEVMDSVAIAFDERSRLFVVEMRGYPERREQALGRIKLLEDRDGDGRYETAKVFAEGLKWPTGIACWKRGVFVAASPDILYFGDTNDDGVADERRVVFTGFGAGRSRLNMQALVNGLQWGPDGRIYGSTAANGGVVKVVGKDGKGLTLRGADFSFDPISLDLRAEAGTGQYGLTFDDYGRRYLCSNSRHLMAVMYSWPVGRERGMPHPLVDIPVDGGAAEVFRLSKVEPWRVVRTRWRVQGKVGGPVEGGGRAAGYFTSASGLAVYRGHAFPREYRGNVFVGDVGSNLVHRKVIEFPADRTQPVARRAHGEEKREFLASTDNWFRPVQCANGPDGALYVVDMYRETIEHPWSLPESIKKHLDLYSGDDRGRIWRIVPEKHQREIPQVSGEYEKGQLAASMAHENGWVVETASRLLLERKPKVVEETAGSLVGAKVPTRTRVPAIHLFARQRDLGWFGAGLLTEKDPVLRGLAVRLCSPKLLKADSWAKDPDSRVRFELALRLLDPKMEFSVDGLALLAQSSPGDRWILGTVAAAARKRGCLSEVVRAQDRLATAQSLLGAGGSALKESDAEQLKERARRVLAEGAVDSEEKAARWLLVEFAASDSKQLWKWVEGKDQALAVQATRKLVKRPRAEWEERSLQQWKALSPALRREILPQVSDEMLVDALETKVLLAVEVPFGRQGKLRSHQDAALRARAHVHLGKPEERSRAEVLKHYRPALTLARDPKKGKEVFQQRCAVCHQEKESIGPPLASLRNKGAPMLLENLIEPNREVAPQYLLWEVRLQDGGVELGMIAEETDEQVVLFRADGKRLEIERNQVSRLTNLNRSLMPAGLEAGLSQQEMADLLGALTN